MNSKKKQSNKKEIPKYKIKEFKKRKTRYCLCIPIINEGEKFKKQLQKIKKYTKQIDVIIADGGSNDDSTNPDNLRSANARTLLTKTDQGKLSAQLRMAFDYAIKEGYEGIITIDGNGKDDPSAIPFFIKELDRGYDFIQGSRFIKNGNAQNTPFSRLFAIRFIHSPIISIASGFHYTDTTNGFRGHSRRYLLDSKLQIFRKLFDTYELLAYLSIRPKQLGYKVKEIPVIRSYPIGKIPTKINGLKGNMQVLSILFNAVLGKYNPTENER